MAAPAATLDLSTGPACSWRRKADDLKRESTLLRRLADQEADTAACYRALAEDWEREHSASPDAAVLA